MVREPWPTSPFTQLLSSEVRLLSFCFTSTKTIRLIGDGEPRVATSTFTQFLSPEVVLASSFLPWCLTSLEATIVRANRDTTLHVASQVLAL